jgi:hypothetical protein
MNWGTVRGRCRSHESRGFRQTFGQYGAGSAVLHRYYIWRGEANYLDVRRMVYNPVIFMLIGLVPQIQLRFASQHQRCINFFSAVLITIFH